MRKRRLTVKEQVILAKMAVTHDARFVVTSGDEALIDEGFRVDSMAMAMAVAAMGPLKIRFVADHHEEREYRTDVKCVTLLDAEGVLLLLRRYPRVLIQEVARKMSPMFAAANVRAMESSS